MVCRLNLDVDREVVEGGLPFPARSSPMRAYALHNSARCFILLSSKQSSV